MGKRVTLTQQVAELKRHVEGLMLKHAEKLLETPAPTLVQDQVKYTNDVAVKRAMAPAVNFAKTCKGPNASFIATDRKERVLRSLVNSLRRMNSVQFFHPSSTGLRIETRYNQTRHFYVDCTPGEIVFRFTKQNGQSETETFERNSDAAASIAATVMFYCMKQY